MNKAINIKKIEHLLFALNIVIAIFAVIIVAVTFFCGDYESTRITKSENVYELDPVFLKKGAEESELIDFPTNIRYTRGEALQITGTLPDELPDNYGVMINSNYCSVKIYADGDLIGTFANETPLSFGRLVGNIRVIAPLTQDYAGKELIIESACYYTGALTLNGVYIGDIDALKLNILLSNIWRIIVCVSMLTLTFLCVGISFSSHFVNNPTNNWAFYHLGFFAFYIQLWLFCSSDLPQFVTNANETVSLVSYISLALLPIHFCAFCSEIFAGSRLYFSIIQVLCWIYLFFMLLGFVTTFFDPPEILIANHLLIFASMVVSIMISFIRIRSNPDDKHATAFAGAVGLLVLTVALALGFFYRMPTSGLDGIVLGVGILAFAFYLFTIILRVEIEFISNLQKNEIYKEFAYMDMMTDMQNRRAFNERLQDIDTKEDADKLLYDMVVLDVNNLKIVNDVNGHDKGDELIIGAATCIRRAFESVGEVYRIGGDEFAVIVENNHQGTMKAAEHLDNEISLFNQSHPELNLSISRGVSSAARTDCETGLLSSYLFRVADEKMYKNKEYWHMRLK